MSWFTYKLEFRWLWLAITTYYEESREGINNRGN